MPISHNVFCHHRIYRYWLISVLRNAQYEDTGKRLNMAHGGVWTLSLLQTLNNSVRGRAKVSSTSLISDQSSLDLNSCRYLQEDNREDLAMSYSRFAPEVKAVKLKKVSITSWTGSAQFEGLRLWCGNRHFGSGSPSQSAGWAIFEENLLFLWYWWHHLASGSAKKNWLVNSFCRSSQQDQVTATGEDLPVSGSALGCSASNWQYFLWLLFGRPRILCLAHLQPSDDKP